MFGIKFKLISVFTSLLLAIILITFIGNQKVDLIDNKMDIINDQNSLKQRYAINFRGSVHDRAIAIRDVVLSEKQSDVEKAISNIDVLEKFYVESESPLDILMKYESSDEEKRMLQKIEAIEKETQPFVKEIIKLINDEKPVKAKEILIANAKPSFTLWLNAINEFIDYQELQNKKETKEVREITSDFSGFMLMISSITISIALIIGFLTLRSLINSLGGEPIFIAKLLQKMSIGDLTNDIENSKDGSVLYSLQKLQLQLSQTLEEITNTANNIESQKDLSSDGSNQLLVLSNEQKQFNDKANNSLQNVRFEANTISDLLNKTISNSSDCLDSSTEGVKSVELAASEIRNIHTTVTLAFDNTKTLELKIKDISGMTETISAISDQTNLLALNAAIEAARAGDSGRGFAVVADEVRGLAKRTGEATNEIEVMLKAILEETSNTVSIMEASLPQLEKGIELSEKSSVILNLIEEKTKNSAINIESVANASNTQTQLIEELHTNMSGVVNSADEMSNISKSFYNKSESESKSLGLMASNLKIQVDHFKLKA